jgi:hypothetical protein
MRFKGHVASVNLSLAGEGNFHCESGCISLYVLREDALVASDCAYTMSRSIVEPLRALVLFFQCIVVDILSGERTTVFPPSAHIFASLYFT